MEEKNQKSTRSWFLWYHPCPSNSLGLHTQPKKQGSSVTPGTERKNMAKQWPEKLSQCFQAHLQRPQIKGPPVAMHTSLGFRGVKRLFDACYSHPLLRPMETHALTHTHECVLCLYQCASSLHNTTPQWPTKTSLYLRGHTCKHYLITHRTRWKRDSKRGWVMCSLLDILLYINLIEMDNTQHLHQRCTATLNPTPPSQLFDLRHSLIPPFPWRIIVFFRKKQSLKPSKHVFMYCSQACRTHNSESWWTF